MQITNLYAIDGCVDSNGKYIADKNIYTIIAECAQKDVDKGCYYFVFLTYSKIDVKSQNYLFIEIPNLLTFVTENSVANFKKVKFAEPTKKIYETYLTDMYEAKNKVYKMSVESIKDKQK